MKENVESELRYRLEEKTGDLKEKQLRIKQLEYELFKLEEELEVKHTKQIQLKEKEINKALDKLEENEHEMNELRIEILNLKDFGQYIIIYLESILCGYYVFFFVYFD